jgi:hypothetical protein
MKTGVLYSLAQPAWCKYKEKAEADLCENDVIAARWARAMVGNIDELGEWWRDLSLNWTGERVARWGVEDRWRQCTRFLRGATDTHLLPVTGRTLGRRASQRSIAEPTLRRWQGEGVDFGVVERVDVVGQTDEHGGRA